MPAKNKLFICDHLGVTKVPVAPKHVTGAGCLGSGMSVDHTSLCAVRVALVGLS